MEAEKKHYTNSVHTINCKIKFTQMSSLQHLSANYHFNSLNLIS